MKDGSDEQRTVSGWALPASLGLHLAIAALVIFGLPVSLLHPEEEQAVEVDLVPPPKPEEVKAEPPPPQDPPPEEKPQETKAEEPPAVDNAPRPVPAPVLQPAFRFGDKDAGPREARDGNSAEQGVRTPEPEQEEQPDGEEAAEPPALTAARSNAEAALPRERETQAPKAAEAEKEKTAAKVEEAKRLFSPKVTGDVIATTAMGGLPRGVRAARLCVTELREQLQNGLPPYYPDLLPSQRLEEGTVIDAPTAAFRVNGQWYDLSYRCEVDDNATRVVGFAFRVGELLPPSEWRRRGLPVR